MSFEKKSTVEVVVTSNNLRDLESLSQVLSNPDSETKFQDFNDKFDPEQYGLTRRGLTSRHMSLMILGQSIGTGMFIGLSTPLVNAGSLSLFLGFLAWAVLMIWPLMQCVGEMCCYLPLRGSFIHFAARWVDPALGFASALIYFYTSCMFVCVEATAFAGIIAFWRPEINAGVWITIALVSFVVFNSWAVRIYGEIEFYSSTLKVLLIVGLMLFSLISMCGGNPKGDAYGFSNWNKGGLVKEYLADGAWGRLSAVWSVMLYAAFSCGGPDLLAIVAGEARRPRTTVALGARRAFIRIYLFYFGGIFFMNSLCASTNEALLAARESGAAGAGASPWVIGIRSVGVKGLDSLVNVLFMCNSWSCANAFFYGSTRTAYAASLAGYLPRIFSKCLSNGAPIASVILVFALTLLSYLSVSASTGEVFNWFINLSTTGALCAFISFWWSYFNFRKAMKVQGKDLNNPDYPYFTAPKFVHPWMTYFAASFNVAVLLLNGYWIFFPGQFSVANLFTAYFAPVLFVCLFLFWKIFKKTHFRTSEEADLTTGKEAIDLQEELDTQEDEARPIKQGWHWKIAYKLADILFN